MSHFKLPKSARESFRWFWYQVATDFNRIVPANAMALIKAAFCDDFNDPESPVEHMFVDQISFDGEKIHGVLSSEPNWIKSVQEGDDVALTLEQVGDWICVVGEVVYGAFSVQVIRSKMSADERQAHDDAWGLPFPEIGSNNIPERSEEFESMITEHLKNAISENAQIVTMTDETLRTPLRWWRCRFH